MWNDEDPIDEDPVMQLIFGVETTVMPVILICNELFVSTITSQQPTLTTIKLLHLASLDTRLNYQFYHIECILLRCNGYKITLPATCSAVEVITQMTWQSPVQLFNFENYENVQMFAYPVPTGALMSMWQFYAYGSRKDCELKTALV